MKNNMNNLVKQAQQMQLKISALQNELGVRELETSVGGGVIKIKINGKQEILNIKISRECVDLDDLETLEQLVKTGVNQAIKESNEIKFRIIFGSNLKF